MITTVSPATSLSLFKIIGTPEQNKWCQRSSDWCKGDNTIIWAPFFRKLKLVFVGIVYTFFTVEKTIFFLLIHLLICLFSLFSLQDRPYIIIIFPFRHHHHHISIIFLHQHHISIVFPLTPPSPHFYCFYSTTTTTTFLLFSSTTATFLFFLPRPPPHFNFFFHHYHHHHISFVFPYHHHCISIVFPLPPPPTPHFY